MLILEMRDADTGELVATNSAARFREDNYDDEAVLAAIDQMERGEIREAALGFYRLVVLYPSPRVPYVEVDRETVVDHTTRLPFSVRVF